MSSDENPPLALVNHFILFIREISFSYSKLKNMDQIPHLRGLPLFVQCPEEP